MPFLAMKMDSSLPNIENTTARITKKGTFTQTIWTILRYNLVRKRGFHQSLVSLVSTICQGDTNTINPKQANANIAVLNALGIPRSYSFPSNTICIISTPSNRSMVMGNHKQETIFVSLWFSCKPSDFIVYWDLFWQFSLWMALDLFDGVEMLDVIIEENELAFLKALKKRCFHSSVSAFCCLHYNWWRER